MVISEATFVPDTVSRRIAYCYLTDGGDDAEMRSWSIASLQRFCGPVDVFVCTVDGLYRNPRPDETVLDLGKQFHEVYGKTVRPEVRCAGCRRFPQLIFAKFLLPFVPELSGYDVLVMLDGDIEVLRREFGTLSRVEMPPEADIGLCPSPTWGSEWIYRNPGMQKELPELWADRLFYHTAGIILTRGAGPWVYNGYLSRLRNMLAMSNARKYRLPEEYAASINLAVCTLPPAFHTIPRMREANRPGAEGDLLKAAYCLHYGGPRKKAVRASWKYRFEHGIPTDPLHLVLPNA